ncbi:MAG TPA: ECF transporter S component [Chloroflexota bacterium]|nr:ECF transporter S component [Chloroflexota bacterium]
MATTQGSLRTTGLDWQWRTRDFIVSAALAVPLGLVWSFAYGFVWLTARGIQPLLGDVFDGFYIVGGVLVGYVIRRPGAALLGELLAAAIEIPFTGFGAVVLWLGLVQGLGVEIVFLATRYRRFDLPIMLLAGAIGALVAVVGYSYPAEGWLGLAAGVQIVRLVLKLVGGAILAGLVGKLIGDALVQTGVLNNFPIGRGREI